MQEKKLIDAPGISQAKRFIFQFGVLSHTIGQQFRKQHTISLMLLYAWKKTSIWEQRGGRDHETA